MDNLKEHILKLENDLLKSEIRKRSEKINELLSNEFIEFCSSEGEYYYQNGDVFQESDDNNELDWEITEFKIKMLSDDCILAMYKLIKHDEISESKKYSLRSSIWKLINGKWKMFFHQGTCTERFDN